MSCRFANSPFMTVQMFNVVRSACDWVPFWIEDLLKDRDNFCGPKYLKFQGLFHTLWLTRLALMLSQPLGWGQFSPTSHTRRIETHCKPRTKTIPQVKQLLIVIWTISRIKAEAVNMEFLQEPVCDVINPPPTQFGDQHLTKSSSSCSSWPAEGRVRLVSYPTRWYLLFVFGFLWWTSS